MDESRTEGLGGGGRYWRERAEFWRAQAIELGWRERRDGESVESPTAAAAPVREGAVAWHVVHDDGGSHVMLADTVDDKFVQALVASSRRVRPLIYGDTQSAPAAQGFDAGALAQDWRKKARLLDLRGNENPVVTAMADELRRCASDLEDLAAAAKGVG